MRIRQSDLASYARCAQQKKLVDLSRQGLVGKPAQLSMTAYGSVVHYAVHVLEKLHFQGREDALEKAKATFVFYWDPANISQICEPVDIWAARQTWHGLLKKGQEVIEVYYARLQSDKSKLLGLEVEFNLPFVLDGEEHTLHGTMDRLSLRKTSTSFLNIEDYKGLALDTPLPTPGGWTTMGAVRVGDQVLGADGRPTNVVAKSSIHEKPCYRVAFDDGTSVVCDEDHLWTTLDARSGEAVRGVRDIRDSLFTAPMRSSRGATFRPQRRHSVANAAALDLPEVELPIDPYVYGCWLGDGTRTRGEITKGDPELFDLIEARGHAVGPDIAGKARCATRTVYGLTRLLADAHLLGHRTVPASYLRGSQQQRLDLLRGLMDTDGSWHKGRNRAVFTTCTKELAATVAELVASLGWKAHVFQVVRHGFGQDVDAWDVCFTPVDANPFSLPRKADLVRLATTVRSSRRVIRSIEPTLTVPTQCIQVDAADSMYLCGEAMVPTHNTGQDYKNLRWNAQFTMYSWATLQPGFWDAWGDEGPDLHARFSLLPRRGTWISLRDGAKRSDAGWRGPQDYERLWAAIRGYVDAVKKDVYPLSLKGDVCEYCAFREGICGGVAVPDPSHGGPA